MQGKTNFAIRVANLITGTPALLPNDVLFQPTGYSGNVSGGYDQADINVYGRLNALIPLLDWLGHKVEILNVHRSVVWTGRILEIVVYTGAIELGYSLNGVVNRVCAFYNNDQGTAQTPWAQDDDSVAQFGVREFRLSAPDSSEERALYHRDMTLQRRSQKVRICQPSATDEIHAVFRCAGPAETLKNKYYVQPVGIEANNTSGGGEQMLGCAFSAASSIGFIKNANKINDLGGRFKYFPNDHKIRVSGSASNNGDFLITNVDSRDVQSYTATSIGADPTDDIHDDDSQLGFIEIDDYILTAGFSSSQNNGIRRCTGAGADHITVYPKTILGASPGPSVTISRGNYVTVGSNLVSEKPDSGHTVLVQVHGLEIRQQFALGQNSEPIPLDQVVIRAQKSNYPIDSLQLDVLYDDGVGGLGPVLESALIDGTLIGQEMGDAVFQFSRASFLEYGRNYHIRIKRTGSYDAINAWIIEVDEELHYGRGGMSLWTGLNWTTRQTPAQLVFTIRSVWETTKQAQKMIEQAQFVDGVDLKTPSARYTNQQRAGDTTIYDELQDLLALGTGAQKRLLATMTDNWLLRLEAKKDKPSVPLYRYKLDGTLATTQDIPPIHGYLPLGEWVEIDGLSREMAKDFTIYVERADYDCLRDELKIQSENTVDVWGLGLIE